MSIDNLNNGARGSAARTIINQLANSVNSILGPNPGIPITPLCSLPTIPTGAVQYAIQARTACSSSFPWTASNGSGIVASYYRTDLIAGDGAVAHGRYNTASGQYSHAEGLGTIAYSDYQHATGRFNTNTNTDDYFVIGDGIDANNRSNAFGVNATRMYASNSIFFPDLTSTAQNNVLTYNSTTKQVFFTASSAIGGGGAAANPAPPDMGIQFNNGGAAGVFDADSSFLFNYNSPVLSLMQGNSVSATGQYSHAEGYQTLTDENYSHAEGNSTTTYGLYSHTEGWDTQTGCKGYYTNDFGVTVPGVIFFPQAYGNILNSFNFSPYQIFYTDNISGTIEYQNIDFANSGFDPATGQTYIIPTNSNKIINGVVFVFIVGNSNPSPGNWYTFKMISRASHAEGKETVAIRDYTHAEGRTSIAWEIGSHAEGSDTDAKGLYSHTEGLYSQTLSNTSHAEGENSIAGRKVYSGSMLNGVITLSSDYGDVVNEFMNIGFGIWTYLFYGSGPLYGEPITVPSIWQVGPNIFQGYFPIYTLQCYYDVNTNTTILETATTVTENKVLVGPYVNNNRSSPPRADITLGQGSHAEGCASTSGFLSHAEASGNALGIISHAKGAGFSAGAYSSAEGYNTYALGRASHVEGDENTASGSYSHAEGRRNIAIGTASHAEGYQTRTYADCSHAEGKANKTYGYASHAEGLTTETYGYASHAEGWSTVAYGQVSHAEGWSTLSSGSHSHAEGVSSRAMGEASHAEGRQSISSGSFSHAEGDTTYSNGDGSHAEGNFSTAEGYCSHAEGYSALASGSWSHAEGNFTQAIGQYSHAEGAQTIAFADYQHATGRFNLNNNTEDYFVIGDGDINTGIRSNAFGVNATRMYASNSIYFPDLTSTSQNHILTYNATTKQVFYTASSAIGGSVGGSNYSVQYNNNGTLSGDSNFKYQYTSQSLMIGTGTSTPGQYSIASGYQTVASGYASFAAGQWNLASGNYSLAVGLNNTASQASAIALGEANYASGTNSYASGYTNIASGYASFAAGQNNASLGNYSVTLGLGNIASGSNQTIIGKYNIQGNTTDIFVVGNGLSTSSRSDAFKVNTTGYVVMPYVSASCNFANDAAAQAGGVPLGGIYHTNGALKIRLV